MCPKAWSVGRFGSMIFGQPGDRRRSFPYSFYLLSFLKTSIYRVGITCLVVELLPDDSVAPFDGLIGVLRNYTVHLMQQLHIIIRRHGPQQLGCASGAFGVHIAELEGGLYPPDQAHPPVIAKHLAYFGVRAALDAVVGGRQRTCCGELGIQVGEQLPALDQTQQ